MNDDNRSDTADVDVPIIQWTGAALKAARERRGLSIEDLAQKTRIRKGLISEIEQENFALLPPSAFLRGLVFQIAKELGLVAEDVARDFLNRRTEE